MTKDQVKQFKPGQQVKIDPWQEGDWYSAEVVHLLEDEGYVLCATDLDGELAEPAIYWCNDVKCIKKA